MIKRVARNADGSYVRAVGPYTNGAKPRGGEPHTFGWLYTVYNRLQPDGAGEPHTFGWLRRKDLEDSSGQVWERPDGQLVKFPPDRRPALVRYAGMPLV